MDINTLKQLFDLAGVKVTGVPLQMENQYWPKAEPYREISQNNPWWEVPTEHGDIVIGWRKHVISIDWSKTNLRGEVTDDDVTKSFTHVHAWSLGMAIVYLSRLRYLERVNDAERDDEVAINEGGRDEVVRELNNFIRYEGMIEGLDQFNAQRRNVIGLLDTCTEEEAKDVKMVTRKSKSGFYHEITLNGLIVIIGAGRV